MKVWIFQLFLWWSPAAGRKLICWDGISPLSRYKRIEPFPTISLLLPKYIFSSRGPMQLGDKLPLTWHQEWIFFPWSEEETRVIVKCKLILINAEHLCWDQFYLPFFSNWRRRANKIIYFKMKVMSWVKSSVFLMLWVLSWQRYVHCFTSWKKIEEEST